MKHCLILIGILFNLFFNIPSVYAEKKNDLIKTAEVLSDAILRKDYKIAVNMFEPSVVDSMGGEDAVILKLKEDLLLREKEKIFISEVEMTGRSPGVKTEENEEYAVVYTTITVLVEGEKMFTDSYQVFVTRDGFPFWFFVASGEYSIELILKDLLGNKYTMLNIPKRMFYNEDRSLVLIDKNGKWVTDEKTYEDLKNLLEKADGGAKEENEIGIVSP